MGCVMSRGVLGFGGGEGRLVRVGLQLIGQGLGAGRTWSGWLRGMVTQRRPGRNRRITPLLQPYSQPSRSLRETTGFNQKEIGNSQVP